MMRLGVPLRRAYPTLPDHILPHPSPPLPTRVGGAQVQMAGLQAQQLAWQQENLAARLAGLRAAAAQADLTQLLKARPLMLTRTGADQGLD